MKIIETDSLIWNGVDKENHVVDAAGIQKIHRGDAEDAE